MPSIIVYDLRCEYRKHPVGIDVLRPRLSWKLAADRRNVGQETYRIQVAVDESFRRLVWDTGLVRSDRSVHVEYEGEPLQSRTRYYYRVQAGDRTGCQSEWSDGAFWETALLKREEWLADWIAPPARADKPNVEIDYLRKTFRIQGEVSQARIYATAHGLYKLFVNGKTPDDTLFAPGYTSYRKRLQYQTYDVTHLLANGTNAIGVMLGNGWYIGDLGWMDGRHFYGTERALLMQLHVTYVDGRQEMIMTDEGWRGSTGALLMSELYHGETCDARLAQEGWHRADFPASDWQSVEVRALTKDPLIAQEGEPVRIVEKRTPVAVFVTPRGEIVLDMGQNMVGWMRFRVEADAGTVITLRHAEVLDQQGNFYVDNIRSARQTVRYICKGGESEEYEPSFSFQGFRYVQVEGLPIEGLADRFVACVIHTDMEPAGSFRCSDEMVNQLQRNIVWGQKGNFLEVPTDCPQRDERLGWTGDAQVFARTGAFNFNVAPFFAKWLKDLAADQQPDGGVSHVVPDLPFCGYNSSAWGDAAVIVPWTIYQCYGDVRLLETQYPSMKAWVDYIRNQGEDECLWNSGFHFGDWLALDGPGGRVVGATPKDLIATAFYAHSASLVAKAAAVLGYEEDSVRYKNLLEGIVNAYRKEFVSPNGRVVSPTQTAYVLSLMFDLLQENDRPRTARMLAEHVKENGMHLTTGFVGTPYLCHVLTRFGYHDIACQLVLQKEFPSWLYSVGQGATTIWEHWDGIKADGSFWSEEMNSFNHYAFGAIGDWLYRAVAGIDTDPAAPGFKHIIIEPHRGDGLSAAEAVYWSAYGEIRSAWETTGNARKRLEVSIPPNTTATIILSGADPGRLTETGQPYTAVEGFLSSEIAESGIRLLVGSGHYSFEY
ncbi:family 78 glycoside hydrolase catalytic domain [Cohnella hashimotonis]|uniref:alpha-L-rhamnosidase n=1 Tax=Cohnella hashimotonis TaxID=2826895 RepID=A0ABT6TL54_9BACL|nr:family 78 glycoside hydrolase catalytic domain [Cohnella hashimotonis]MDI4647444.1 family 78 glycoside hydrolase catalytic domain [Cohnella hashimotonis]